MKDWNIRTIVLGYEGSKGADRALELAAAVARLHKANVVVFTAFETRRTDLDEERIGRMVAGTHDSAEKAVRELEGAGVADEPDVLKGSAGDALLNAAENRKADLIVVGRRGHSLVADLLLGSTSEHVVCQAKVPVLVAHWRADVLPKTAHLVAEFRTALRPSWDQRSS